MSSAAADRTRHLDRQVAEALGWTNLHWRDAYTSAAGWAPAGWYGDGPNYACYLTDKYSTDIAAAWTLIEHLRSQGWDYVLADVARDTHELSLYRDGYETVCKLGPTAPAAIVAAFLEAMMPTRPGGRMR